MRLRRADADCVEEISLGDGSNRLVDPTETEEALVARNIEAAFCCCILTMTAQILADSDENLCRYSLERRGIPGFGKG